MKNILEKFAISFQIIFISLLGCGVLGAAMTLVLCAVLANSGELSINTLQQIFQ